MNQLFVYDDNHEKDIEMLQQQYPEDKKEIIKELYNTEDTSRIKEICEELLQIQKDDTVLYFFLTSLAIDGDEQYKLILKDLLERHPEEDIILYTAGALEYAHKNLKKAMKYFEKIYPLKRYIPHYNISYGSCLECSHKFKKAREAYYQEIKYFVDHDYYIDDPKVLLTCIRSVLLLDIQLYNGHLQEDMDILLIFINKVEMDSTIERDIVGTISFISTKLKNKWIQPIFLDFIQKLEQHHPASEVLEHFIPSTFTAYESYLYCYDKNISPILRNYLTACSNYQDHQEYADEIEYYFNEWCICEQSKQSMDWISYLKEEYPHTYAKLENKIENIHKNPAEVQKEVLRLLVWSQEYHDEADARQECKKFYNRLANKKNRI